MAKSHISNRASGASTLQAMKYEMTHQKLCSIHVIWPSFTVFYYFNFTKYFVNIMESH
jgi:hypothetical protein